jgi:hypothetical protein
LAGAGGGGTARLPAVVAREQRALARSGALVLSATLWRCSDGEELFDDDYEIRAFHAGWPERG